MGIPLEMTSLLMLHGVSGNLKQLLDRNGWGFLSNLTESYPGVAKLYGPLGVRRPVLHVYELPSSLLPQRRMLYVFDPTAMHSIIVKEQYVFEEAEFFIKSVRRLPTIKARSADSPYRTNRLVFGPGLLGTLGSVWLILYSIRHTNRMNVRGAPSETAQVTQPSVLDCSHATHDPYLHRCRT